MSHNIYTGPSAKITSLTAQLTAPTSSSSSSQSRSDPDDELDEEALFAELEAEIENEDGHYREHGIKQLQLEMERVQKMRQELHGKYTEITDEKQVIQTSANEQRCIIHFYHSNFRRCEIMDKHLAALAPKYFHTRFIRVFVENVPFLVEKLGIQVLPCVMCFVQGVSKDRIVGFGELGNSDKFSTATLELRLQQCDVIQKEPQVAPTVRHVATAFSGSSRLRQSRNDDSDFDLDD